MKHGYTFGVLICLAVLISGQAFAAGPVYVRAAANPELAPGYIQRGADFTIDYYMEQASGEDALGLSVTFKYHSPDLSISNVSHRDLGGDLGEPSILMLNGMESTGGFWNIMNALNMHDWDGVLPDTFNYTTIGIPVGGPAGWPAGPEELYFQVGMNIAEEGYFCIDSINLFIGTYDWAWGGAQQPEFNGPYCWNVVDNLPAEIGVDPDNMNFTGVAFGAPISPKTLQVSNEGFGDLEWTATWNSSWLDVAPSSAITGGAPTTVQVSVNTTGLGVGEYRDTIVVSDPMAVNDPVRVPVLLTLTDPPPTIGLSENIFNFNAIADGANPDDQYLTISNIGMGTLNWTAAHSSSWLSVAPDNGVDEVEVTLSIDITGLTYGIYYDTVVVSDPAATNNPQKAAVRLEVASDLPILAADLQHNIIVVEIPPGSPPNRQFQLYNAGAGSMTFTSITETSPRILLISPTSGTVPQEIDVEFKILHGDPPTEYFDTVWVESPEAVNSPYPVIFEFHIVSDAAEIFPSKDSLYIEYYECWQGYDPLPGLPSFRVYNAGGDEFQFAMSYESDWLHLTPMWGAHGTNINTSFDYEGKELGIYLDSIKIEVDYALNSPYYIPVVMNIVPTPTTPELLLSATSFEMTAQEEKTGKSKIISVYNANPGCMEWDFSEALSWITYTIEDTSAILGEDFPQQSVMHPNAYGLTMGEYNGMAEVSSPDASNSPIPIDLKLWVWRFHGDMDYDGVLNLTDILLMIIYVYHTGTPPIPDLAVGDCNCNGTIDLADILVLIDYIYLDGPPPCGNPYK